MYVYLPPQYFQRSSRAYRFPVIELIHGAAGVLSGYFAPFGNRLAASGPPVSPFGGSSELRERNTPLDEVRALPAGTVIPAFWLGAGAADGEAVAGAETFRQVLLPRQGRVPLTPPPEAGTP
ncbi:MAG TPA: hypothetical protein VFX25_38215 [Streptosporangiaceae bacterium]|nr:hypothetical protein [Streptosporangiaceae bacterium]HEX5294740.1 hypothetical protein [Streptosporangiaceae bacterium]